MGRANAKGHRDEFAQVFEAHRHDVVRLAYLLTGDAEAAKDAAAEAFARTYDHWRRGRVERVEGYVRRAVVNHVNSHFRRLARQRRLEERYAGDDRGLLDHDERSAAADEMRVLLRQLPRRQRTAVVLRFWEDLTVEQIADAMACPAGTVKSLLSRGMERLREGVRQDSAPKEVCHG